MNQAAPLVSICLPARNGAASIAGVVRSVLSQDHADLELVISDNASTDDTQAVCQELARSDSRIRYFRQAENIGLLANFLFALAHSRGSFVRWIGDDDWLSPEYASRSLAALSEHPEAVLATTQIEYTDTSGAVSTSASYTGSQLASPDPLERFSAILDVLNAGSFVVDPLYGLMRRRDIVDIPRRNMLQEDQLFAVKLALLAPWVHVPHVLAGRSTSTVPASVTARHLGVSAWQLRVRTSLLCSGIIREIGCSRLSEGQKREAYAAVRRFYVRRQIMIARHRYDRVRRMARGAFSTARSATSAPDDTVEIS